MSLQVDLASDGGLAVILPGGRSLNLGFDTAALRFLFRILEEQKRGKPERGSEKPGFIGEFPTQHVIEIWRKQDLARQSAESLAEQRERAEERRAELAAKGIDIDALDISI